MSRYILVICGGFVALLCAGCASTRSAQKEQSAPATAIAVVPVVIPVTQSAAPAQAPVAQPSKVAAEDFSPDAVLAEMLSNGTPIRGGYSESVGSWIICTERIVLSDGLTPQRAGVLAEIRAKKRIAAYIGEAVSAHETASVQSTTIGDETIPEEFYSSMIHIDVNQLLRGITPLHKTTSNGMVTFSYYVTGKIANAAKALQQSLSRLPAGTVQALGLTNIGIGSLEDARKRALDGALRNAVEQVCGTIVVGKSQMMDDELFRSKFFTNSIGCVKQYRIQQETKLDGNYRMVLLAEVDKDGLLENYSALLLSIGNPAFYVKTPDPDLYIAFSGLLSDLGFRVVADMSAADFVFEGDCEYLKVVDGHYGDGIQIDLSLRLLDANGSHQYFAIRNHPVGTSTYSGNYNQIRQRAAAKAFRQMKQTFLEKVNAVVLNWFQNGRPVTVVAKNLAANAAQTESFEEMLDSIPAAKVVSKKIEHGDVVFMLSISVPMDNVLYFLRERVQSGNGIPGNLEPRFTEMSSNSLEVVF